METMIEGGIATHDMRLIHSKLHDKQGGSVITLSDGNLYPIELNKDKLPYVKYRGILFMVQNPKKPSKFAERARNGEKITWGIRPGNWIFINDEKIEI